MITLPPETETLQEVLVRKDTARLQGAWKFVSGSRVARLRVAGDQFTIHFRNGDVYAGRFTLDPTHRPKAIDLVIDDGPERHKGKTSLGLYLLDGKHLMLCPGVPGCGERPDLFPAPGDTGSLYLVFERDESAA